jgi:hypothetical protein
MDWRTSSTSLSCDCLARRMACQTAEECLGRMSYRNIIRRRLDLAALYPSKANSRRASSFSEVKLKFPPRRLSPLNSKSPLESIALRTTSLH